MVEQYIEMIHTEHSVLDIGQDIGALVIYTREELRGREIEVSPLGNDAQRTHTAVLERKVSERSVFAALFLALAAGDYTIWKNATTPAGSVTIVGGAVAEVDWRNISDSASFGRPHPHEHASSQLVPFTVSHMLPPRYQNGCAVSSAPMGSAPLLYDDDGRVAWNRIWTDFCDLALAGGPPHRGTLLEPVAPEEVNADLDAYERVVAEIERGLRLATDLPTVRSKSPGWVGLYCVDEEMALWLLRAIIVENVCVRREGSILFLPAGPAFRLEKEIKNVVTVVAKTYHYCTEHRSQ